MSDQLRVHDCLYNGCWKRTDECKRCDEIVRILKEMDKEVKNVSPQKQT